MDKIYARQIKLGNMNIYQVPPYWRERVRQLLSEDSSSK